MGHVVVIAENDVDGISECYVARNDALADDATIVTLVNAAPIHGYRVMAVFSGGTGTVFNEVLVSSVLRDELSDARRSLAVHERTRRDKNSRVFGMPEDEHDQKMRAWIAAVEAILPPR